MIEIDSFLDFPDRLIAYSNRCEFKDEVNPVDGVVYPRICKDIPEEILNDVFFNITHRLGRAPIDPLCFMRQSPKGVPVPHKYHTDNSMGHYSMMIYLQDMPDAGTGLAQHVEMGLIMAPADQGQLEKAIKDCNDDSKWQIYKVAEMVKNKAVIFDSRLFHVALPIGGFGKAQGSRTVFTCFFS